MVVGIARLRRLRRRPTGSTPATVGWRATLGVGMLGLGFGLTAWGKYLMPQGPFVEERHDFHSTDEERDAFAAAIAGARRPRGQAAQDAARRSSPSAAAILTVALLFPLLRSLGPMPAKSEDTEGRPRTRSSPPTGRRAPSWSTSTAGRSRSTTSRSAASSPCSPQGFAGLVARPGHPDPPGPARPERPAVPDRAPGQDDLGRPGLRRLLQALHPPRAARSASTSSSSSSWSARATSRCSTSRNGAVPAVRPGAPPAAPAAAHRRRDRATCGPRQLRPARRPRLLGALMTT